MHAREGECMPGRECARENQGRRENALNKPSKWMKVTMKVTVEDNHAETMAGYKLAAEDTSTSTCHI
jgi:hypothetical protein